MSDVGSMILHKNKNRIYFLDYIRGFLILMVILQHTLYDLDQIFGVSLPFLWTDFAWTVRDFGVVLFVGISGFCANLSRSNLRRGVFAAGIAAVITLVTYTFIYSQRISFGIIHMLACCMILYGLLQPVLEHISPWVFVWGGAILFFFLWGVPDGYVGIGSLVKWPLPGGLYESPWLFALGFPNSAYVSADYYPLIPWIFAFLCGGGLGRIVLARRHPGWWYRNPLPALGWIGRNTLLLYILHQPIVYGILWILFDRKV